MVVFWAARRFKEVIFKKPKPSLQLPGEITVSGGVDVALQAVEIIAGVKVINPLVVWQFRIPPSSVGQHREAAVTHSAAGYIEIVQTVGMLCAARKSCSSQHISIVNRFLCMRKVTQAISAIGTFPWQGHDPVASARSYVEEPFIL